MLRSLHADAVKIPFKQWLPNNLSQAFICCIGAGPWKYPRRRKIQHNGLIWLGTRELCAGKSMFDADRHSCNCFPFDWQNSYVSALEWIVPHDGYTGFNEFCARLKQKSGESPTAAAIMLNVACGRGPFEALPKVLSLFLRDALDIPAFPIDRHVRRFLAENHLPETERDLLAACKEAGVNPAPIARYIVNRKLDGGNPDWSGWPTKEAPPLSART